MIYQIQRGMKIFGLKPKKFGCISLTPRLGAVC